MSKPKPTQSSAPANAVRSKNLQVQDLEAEKQGVQEALKAALQMMSERNPRSSERSSERSPQKNEDTRASAAQANDAEISTRIESAAVSNVGCVLLRVWLARCLRESSTTPHQRIVSAAKSVTCHTFCVTRVSVVVRRTTTLTRQLVGGFAAKPPAAPPAEPASPPGACRRDSRSVFFGRRGARRRGTRRLVPTRR